MPHVNICAIRVTERLNSNGPEEIVEEKMAKSSQGWTFRYLFYKNIQWRGLLRINTYIYIHIYILSKHMYVRKM